MAKRKTKKTPVKKVSKKKKTGKKPSKKDLKNFPTLNLKKERDIAEDFASKAFKKFDKMLKSVVLFGSTAKQQTVTGSDIDIILIIDDVTVDWNQELWQASRNGNVEIAKRALKYGADVDWRSGRVSWTPIMRAAHYGLVEVMRLLLACGAEVNAVNNYGTSALFHACCTMKAECVEMLLDAGADWKATIKMTYYGWEKKARSFLQRIIQARTLRRQRATTTILCLKRIGVCRDIANLIGTLVWKDKN